MASAGAWGLWRVSVVDGEAFGRQVGVWRVLERPSTNARSGTGPCGVGGCRPEGRAAQPLRFCLCLVGWWVGGWLAVFLDGLAPGRARCVSAWLRWVSDRAV